ncbi:hypothetical protein CBS147323_4098 [Aspergillus niger]|nr:hypothetical protein CBS133816_1113 [Aspergillus niger]KAI2969120.1 hypothetical protein CBS147323_4098 [Aspergillus niger]KAI2984851.1 hypothetical protein CBS147345_11091 [Aspergillus niger]KAI3029154.1 hypothetical protein CBS147347_3488 [Aspergillus niger]KAI3070943.1 hypothetical protein CBS147353_6653 [Aspergillus niger]
MPVRDSINDTIVLIYHGHCSRGYLLGDAYRGEASLSGTGVDGVVGLKPTAIAVFTGSNLIIWIGSESKAT